jgi:hypothetical protein
VAEAQASCAYRGRLCRELGCGGNCAKPRASHLFKPLFLYYFVCQPSIFSTLKLMQNTSVLSNSENVSRLCLHVQFNCTPSGVKFNTRLRARLAPSGYQYLYQYPNTSFRIFRKTRLPCFRILTTNTSIQILNIRPHTNSNILELTYNK